ncbi:MAG: helix-turn-helix domain-containing protein, partial [Halobacteria archaeon]|nr:helix-turn-helix domain-containing protein [Halobacteria archaeon]
MVTRTFWARLGVLLVVLGVLLVSLPLTASSVVAQSSSSSDVTIYQIHVHENGDVTWTVELRRQLQNQQEVEGFRQLKSNFEAGNVTIFENIEENMRPLVRDAQNTTGRNMSVSGFERDVKLQSTVTGKLGITRVTFNWTNFAEVHNSNISIGDVLVGGFPIGQNSRLVITYDESLTPVRIIPNPDLINRQNNLIQWNGPQTFGEGRPSVVFSLPNQGVGTLLSSKWLPTIIAGIVVLISGFFGGIYLGRRIGWINGNSKDGGVVNGNGSTGETGSGSGSSQGTKQELLTDEDKVIRLLEQNDGRMKQADIVESTGWSKSKVSMVLSDMEEENTISKLRLGRENVIDLENGEDTRDGDGVDGE